MVIQDLTAAAAFCRSVVLLHEGRVVKYGTPGEVITTEMIRRTYGAEVLVFPSPLGGFPQVTYRGED
jgi:ABC-type hemin transport system ATPase subunit